jgi:hypothetical protein
VPGPPEQAAAPSKATMESREATNAGRRVMVGSFSSRA